MEAPQHLSRTNYPEAVYDFKSTIFDQVCRSMRDDVYIGRHQAITAFWQPIATAARQPRAGSLNTPPSLDKRLNIVVLIVVPRTAILSFLRLMIHKWEANEHRDVDKWKVVLPEDHAETRRNTLLWDNREG